MDGQSPSTNGAQALSDTLYDGKAVEGKQALETGNQMCIEYIYLPATNHPAFAKKTDKSAEITEFIT